MAGIWFIDDGIHKHKSITKKTSIIIKLGCLSGNSQEARNIFLPKKHTVSTLVMVLWTNPLIFWQLKTPKKIHWSKKKQKKQKKKQHITKNVPRTGKVIIAWQASIRCNHRNATHPFWMTVDLHGTMAWGKDIFIKWMLGKSSTNHDVPRKNHWTCTMLDIYTLLSMKRQSWMFWHVNVPWKTNPLKIICTNDMKWSNDSKKKTMYSANTSCHHDHRIPLLPAPQPGGSFLLYEDQRYMMSLPNDPTRWCPIVS